MKPCKRRGVRGLWRWAKRNDARLEFEKSAPPSTWMAVCGRRASQGPRYEAVRRMRCWAAWAAIGWVAEVRPARAASKTSSMCSTGAAPRRNAQRDRLRSAMLSTTAC